MVWLVQNCRSNKCSLGALSWNRWGTLCGTQTPLLLTPPPPPPPIPNPGSAPGNNV